MSRYIWEKLKHFKENENWGDPDKMYAGFLTKLDNFRANLNSSMIVTCGTQGVHVKNSLHYQGLAVDFVIPDPNTKILDVVFLALRHDISGIGYYPDWRYKDKEVGGWHFDIGKRKAMWLGLREQQDSKQFYKPLTEYNLSYYGII